MNRLLSLWGEQQKKEGINRPFIIAEIGSNHMNDLSIARDTIIAAVETGADAVKFQSLNLEQLYWSPSDSVRKLYAKIGFNESWYRSMKQFCDQKGIIFFSSPTYFKSVEILESIGVELYKLASAQVGVFPQLVKKVASLGKPTLISTGLVTISELEQSVRYFNEAGNTQFALLHCNSIYPTPPEKVFLDRMLLLKSYFNVPVGFSDHTLGNAVALAAVAKGADIIEKHFTLSRNFDTPDAFFSAEPEEFASLVRDSTVIKTASKPCAGRLYIEQEEFAFKESIRYRLVLSKSKKEFEGFEDGDFEYKRHDSGIDCQDEEKVLRFMRTKKTLDKGTLLDWCMLEGRNEKNSGY